MEWPTLLLLAAAAFGIALLAVATGFGIGTVLTPFFLLAFDIKTAIFLVAIVHFANSFLRLLLFRTHLDGSLLRRFGLLCVAGALAGAFWQERAADPKLELALGALLVVLGVLDFLPARFGWRFPRRFDPLGGLLSGLLGGVLGNQGALRSAFLLNYELKKETFIGTGAAIALLIDLTRLPVYAVNYGDRLAAAWASVLLIVVVSLAGTLVGRRLVAQLKIAWFRRLVGGLIVAAGAALIVANL